MFFTPFSVGITSLGEERANLSAFRTFVRLVLVWICRFPLLLGVWEGHSLDFSLTFVFICGVWFIIIFVPPPSFSAPGRLCLVIAAFPGYLHLCFYELSVLLCLLFHLVSLIDYVL